MQSGQRVITIEDEYDIELIPKNTEILLTRPNGKCLWYGVAIIKGVERIVLINTTNLKLI